MNTTIDRRKKQIFIVNCRCITVYIVWLQSCFKQSCFKIIKSEAIWLIKSVILRKSEDATLLCYFYWEITQLFILWMLLLHCWEHKNLYYPKTPIYFFLKIYFVCLCVKITVRRGSRESYLVWDLPLSLLSHCQPCYHWRMCRTATSVS